MKTPIFALCAALLALPFAGGQSLATVFADDFAYANGPLAGQGGWDRGPNDPTSDNPSNHLVVNNGAVRFDWMTSAPINNVVRYSWGGTADNVIAGSIYAAFDLRVLTVPETAENVRPSFFSFARNDGQQQRGHVGLRRGSAPGTFQVGISADSQDGENFVYHPVDLLPNTTYRIMVSHAIGTSASSLWVGTDDPAVSPVVVTQSGTTTNVRRVNLRMYNSDGEDGTTRLGIFEVDNLSVRVSEARLPFGDSFGYLDGPLSGQGFWQRGVSQPTADNPSNYLVVEEGAVKFDWTTAAPVNNSVRVQFVDDALTEGWIYAAFDLHVAQAPQVAPAAGSAPGFLSFDRSGGGQLRGHVGIRAGGLANTFQLGISASSQFSENFVFSGQNLNVGTTYRVMVGHEIDTGQTRLWINTENPLEAAVASASGSRATDVRRIQLRLYNTNGGGGTTNLGVFFVDNLLVRQITPVVLPVVQASRAVNGIRLEWAQAPGLTARLQYNTDLGSIWLPLETFQTDASGAVFEFTDTGWTPGVPRFYRLEIE